jgi:peptidoglycan hydrolase-like protein with peptidoglycan-binding domain
VKRRQVILTAGAVVALGASTAAAFGFGGADGDTPSGSTQPPKTVDVTRGTLIDYEEVSGELGYGLAVPLRYLGSGVVTWLPAVGAIVERGKPLFKVDNQPVALLYGDLPMYRPLLPGLSGPDVLQLEENLRALGHAGFAADESFTSATTAAVKRWQRAIGVDDSGMVAPGQVLYAPAAIRIADQRVRVGDAAGGDILGFTGTTRRVDVALSVDRQRYATVGGTVQVTLADGKAVSGKVESIGAVITAGAQDNGQESGPPTVAVVVSIADQSSLGTIQQGPAKVRFVVEERKDVLLVPVAALVALTEGGYGVQVAQGSSTRYLAVETGMFAGGRVEVRGSGLEPGVKVVVPK